MSRILTNLRQALRLVWHASPRWTVLSLGLVFVQGMLPLASLYLLKLLVDAIAAGLASPNPVQAFPTVLTWLILAGGAVLVSDLCRSLTTWAATAQAELVQDHVNDLLHAKSVEVDLEYYENAQYHNTLHRAQQQAAYRPTMILEAMVQIGQNGLSLLAMAGLLVSLHWWMAALLLATAVPGLLVRLKYSRELYLRQREWTRPERQAEYMHCLLTEGSFAKEIRLFDLGGLFRERFRRLRGHIRTEKLDLAQKRSLAELASLAGATLALYAAFGLVAWQTLLGVVTLGGLVMYYQAFQRGHTCLWSLLVGLASLYENSLFLTDFNEFLTLQRTVMEPEGRGTVDGAAAGAGRCDSGRGRMEIGGGAAFSEAHAPSSIVHSPVEAPEAHSPWSLVNGPQMGVRFDHVSFSYPRGGRIVLRDISLEIRPGETIALVGENGAGKTTLIKLLCRLYDPTGGRITFGGVDLRDFQTMALRKQISVLFQDFARYNLTVAENIALGNVELLRGSDRSTRSSQLPAGSAFNPQPAILRFIQRAARLAGADAAIARLPHTYETMLGKQFEDGEELSIGQWQKIALARAFLREVPIVVLDEPTSALDAFSERDVLERFRQLVRGRIGVIISHRLSTVTQADRIYVLHEGRIVEAGKHEELLHVGGLYTRLFETQAANYRRVTAAKVPAQYAACAENE